MANSDKPSGLTPVRYLNGSDWDGRGNIYCILAADTNAYHVGQPVIPSSSGGSSSGIPAVATGTPGTGPWLGVILAVGSMLTSGAQGGGPYISQNDLTVTSRPAAAQSTDWFCLVADDPNIIFEAQEDSVGGALAVTNIHNNINLIAAAPATGVVVSGYELDSSTVNTTATLDMRIKGLVKRADNAVGVNAKWEVLFNNHFFKSAGLTGI